MDKISKRLYMREHSNVIRKFQTLKMLDKMEENPVFNIDGTNRLIIVTICRIRQRILTQAWRILTQNTGVNHDYELDARVILSRKLPEDELRTELEIEILFKWIYNTKDIDPTGIANTIYLCKKRSAIYSALQQMRLEFFEPGETVLFQGDIPRPEDGHFTIFNGVCEVLQFPDESMPLMKLLYLAKKKKWDEAKKLLKQALVLARITKSSGFGELSTLTGVKRAATIRTDPTSTTPVEVVIVPKQALLDCLKSRRQDGVEGAAPSEAMDFMRQSGLANRISPNELVRVAQNMIRRTLLQGEILYFKNESVNSLFLVVSGELLLDTGDFMLDGQAQPFINSNPDNCFHMPSGSILGDEGVTGQSRRFESTAVVVSEAAVVFEAVGFGMKFLTEKIGALRYCALTYRDKSRWSPAIQLAEEINPYTYFHSLRKAIAYTHPYRGSRPKIYEEYVEDKRIAKKVVSSSGKRKSSASSKSSRSIASASGRGGGGSGGGSGGKKLPSLMRLDSNLAFMLTADKDHSNENNSEFQLARKLKPVGLHHALDINRTAKKLAQKFVKVHAQENILYDEMTKNLSSAAPGPELEEAEAKFKTYIAEYRDRAKKHVSQVNKEMERERLSRAYTAASASVKFYGALSPDNSVGGGSAHRRTFSGDELSDPDNISQQRPFTAPIKDRAAADADQEGAAPAVHANPPTLNAAEIEKQLSLALQASDEAQANMLLAETGSVASLASYEDEFFHLRPKIVQYFIWMDHLNRHTYRALLAQAQQTIDQNAVKVQDQKLVVTEKTMEELNLIFNRFGLTPTDMNIPWRPNTPKAAAGGTVQFEIDADSDDEEAEEGTHLLRAPATAGSPVSVPILTIPVPGVTLADTKMKAPEGGKLKNLQLPPEDAPKGRLKIPGKLIVYHPSSWRHDLATKKDKGISKDNYRLFTRASTPDNRRVCGRYFHYPGHHHPDFHHKDNHHGLHMHDREHNPHRTLSGRFSGKNTPNRSRPSTAETYFEDHYDTQSVTEQKAAALLHLEELQATFNEEPEKFFEAIKTVAFPVRKTHLPKNEWKTRFLQASGQANHVKPEPERHEKMYRKSKPNLKPLFTRPPAASVNFSKQAMLDSAKNIQDHNLKMYALTDSATILEASMQKIKMRGNRDSFLYGASAKTYRTDASADEEQLGNMDRRHSEELSPGASLGIPSYDEDDDDLDASRDDMGVLLTDRQIEGENAPHDTELVWADGDGIYHNKHYAETALENQAQFPLFDTDASASYSSPTSQNMRQRESNGRDGDDHSEGNGTANEILDQSQLSPVAPAPLHLNVSTYSDNAAMGVANLHVQPTSPDLPGSVGHLTLKLENNIQSIVSSDATGFRSPFNKTSSEVSVSMPLQETNGKGGVDVGAARMKEMKDRILARGSSAALEAFNQYMSTDNNPRTFYVGKKKASANSKFGLSGSLKSSKADAWKPTAAEIELFGAQKSSLSSEIAMFNSLFPDCTPAQRKLFLDKCRLNRAHDGQTGTSAAELAKSAAMSSSKMSVMDLRIEEISASAKSRVTGLNMDSTLGEKIKDRDKDSLAGSRQGVLRGIGEGYGAEESEEEGEEEDLDPDVVLWQSFTIDLMHKEKTGPKKILPVLIMKNEGGASSRRFAVNKSKRWGSGVLLQLASEAEEDQIAGPSSYLEIFKGTQRRRLREKDRLRITSELNLLAK